MDPFPRGATVGQTQVSFITLNMGLLFLCTRARVVDYSEDNSTTCALVHKSKPIVGVMSETCDCPKITPL